MTNRTLIGLMSGSSLDGLDIICVNFWGHQGTLNWEIKGNPATINYPSTIQTSIQHLHNLDDKSIHDLDIQLGKFYGIAVQEYLQVNDVHVDVIASHGHTVRHHPELGYSLQIGDGQETANAAGIPCINQFRSVDISAGGQGAPLAPVVEHYLFRDYQMFLNIGGIANISLHKEDSIVAYDICAANQLLNHLSKQMGQPYDDKGEMARSGNMDTQLIKRFMQDPFLALDYPKSLDNNYIREHYLNLLDGLLENSHDLLASCTHFIARTIGKEISTLAKQHDINHVFVSGGGAFNYYLLELIQLEIGEVKIILPDTKIINQKESILMALCGYLYLEGKPNSFAAATGASRDTINGVIYYPQS